MRNRERSEITFERKGEEREMMIPKDEEDGGR